MPPPGLEMTLPADASLPAMPVAPRIARRRPRRPFNALAFGFILPAVVIVFLVSIYPVFDAFILSLYKTSYAQKVSFTGLANYLALLDDPTFWNDTVNSLIYTGGSLVLVLPLSLGLAMLLAREFPMRGLVRTVVVLPWVVSQTVVALLWAWLLNGDFGPLTWLFEAATGARPAFLSDPSAAMSSLIVVNVWASYPQATLLLLAAVQTIPHEIYEAAAVDGATGLGALRHVTLPLIRPTLLVVMIQLTLLYFNMVTLIYTLTGGGPIGSTETLAVRVMKTSFEDWNLGQGAALGLIITAINLLISLIYIKTLRYETK